jgi:hypothetical protein
MKTMQLSHEMLFYAFRYALGRKTYAVIDVVVELMTHWKELDDRLRRLIIYEIERAIQDDRAGMLCDVEEWKKILLLNKEK